MGHSEIPLLFLQLAVLLGAALLFGEAARRAGFPAVFGELLGGLVLGPSLFGRLFPEAWSTLFPGGGSGGPMLGAILQLGMLFFLFTAGLEVDIAGIRSRLRPVLGATLLGVAVPLVLGVAAVLVWPEPWGEPARRDLHGFALFLGTALSISALPVIARVLSDLSLLDSAPGRTILLAASATDLLGWALFSILVGRMRGNGVTAGPLVGLVAILAIFVLFRLVAAWAERRILPGLVSPEGGGGRLIGATLVVVLVAGAIVDRLGFHAFLGAFLVGAALSSAEAGSAAETIRRFVGAFFAPVYFVSLGLRADVVRGFDLRIVAVVLVVAIVGKVAGGAVGARLGGLPGREALAVGVGLNARGAVEMVLATLALELGLIDERIWVALVVMALVTSLISGPVLARLLSPRR